MQAGQTLEDIQRPSGAPHWLQRRDVFELWVMPIFPGTTQNRPDRYNALGSRRNALTRPQPAEIAEFILYFLHIFNGVGYLSPEQIVKSPAQPMQRHPH